MHVLEFLKIQLCAMLEGTGREGLYGGPCMGWGGEEEDAFSVVGGDVVVK